MAEYGLALAAVVGVLAGIVLGVTAVRYGIGLGSKLVYKTQNGLPLDEDDRPVEQDITGE